MIAQDFMPRLMRMISLAGNFVFWDAPVEEAFDYVTHLDRKTGGSESDDFGAVYRDKKTGQEFLAKYLFAEVDGADHFALKSVCQINSRPKDKTYFSNAEFAKEVELTAPFSADEKALVSFLKKQNESQGRIFDDQRSSISNKQRPPTTAPSSLAFS